MKKILVLMLALVLALSCFTAMAEMKDEYDVRVLVWKFDDTYGSSVRQGMDKWAKAVGDELGPAVEAARVHRPEPALHVRHDLVLAMDGAFPDRAAFLHGEGNSAAHAKTLCTGASVSIPIANGKLLLGTWQGIYFAEYDGPRQRRYYVKIMEG